MRCTNRRLREERIIVGRYLPGVLERAGDDVSYFVDVRDRDRVRGARDFHGLAGPGALGRETVDRREDVLAELPKH
jgi:hypothetical protein